MTRQIDKTVGMIGLGIMGSAMSKNLIAAGFSVIGYDISPEAVEAFKGSGGKRGQIGRRSRIGEPTSSSLRCRQPPHLFDVVRRTGGTAARRARGRGNQHLHACRQVSCAGATRQGRHRDARLPAVRLRQSGAGARRVGVRQRREDPLRSLSAGVQRPSPVRRIISAHSATVRR